ncbi:hypothetical protein TIFTF001_001546 [Ficus carica]|uniref:Uncharacterized protein n=1 Tax=Ficus carica TaxID=3494 RepID=A0AA87Z7Y0_FICCA|nr:hypothetical protein TIFTF001_001546 [Ficus carica]
MEHQFGSNSPLNRCTINQNGFTVQQIQGKLSLGVIATVPYRPTSPSLIACSVIPCCSVDCRSSFPCAASVFDPLSLQSLCVLGIGIEYIRFPVGCRLQGVSPLWASIRIQPGNLRHRQVCSTNSWVSHRRWQMWRRLGSAKQAQTKGLITHYFRVRKASDRAIASCPDPPSSTVYSSSGSNSVTLVYFLKLLEK